MGESPAPSLLSRRHLMRGGAAGIAALASSAALSPSSASASTGTQPAWTNVVDLGADPTGAADSTAAFQTAINNGLPIYVPPGTYTCSRGPLVPTSWTRIFGNSYGATTIQCSGSHLFDMDNSNGFLEGIEIDHVTLSATGGDVFHGAHVARSSVHHCWLVQNSPNHAIWNSSSSTGLGSAYMHECCFHYNKEHQYGSPRSISAWYLDASGAAANCNDNWWYGNSCYNQGHDTTQWWYRVIGSSSGQGGRNNRFQKTVFENPQGGMVRLESCTGTVIDDVTNVNLASLVVGNPLVSIATVAGNSSGCGGIAIRNYSRRGGNNNGGGITDIQLDSNAVQVVIDTPSVYGGGAVLGIDCGSARNVTLIGSPGNGNYTLVNGGGLTLIS
jgi:hypothetical protein